MKISVAVLRIYGWTWWLRLFCWLTCQLGDRIPRYGRVYSFNRDTRSISSKPQWRYFRRGHWGMNILDNLGLFWPYLDYLNPGWNDSESP